MRNNYRLLNLPFPSNAVYLRGFFLYAAGVIPSLFLNCFSFSISLIRAGRVFDFLELNCEEMTGGEEIPVRNGETSINISNLTFSYDGEKLIFDNWNLDIGPDEKVMLMGESGR